MSDQELEHYQRNMTLAQALDRIQTNIDIGREGWSDPELLAALEKVHAAATRMHQRDEEDRLNESR